MFRLDFSTQVPTLQISQSSQAYSIAALWFVFFGGFLLDKFGVKKYKPENHNSIDC